jgi:antitoxin CptB
VSDAAAQELGRLRWRCRRGMKELDLLLTRYVDSHYSAASEDDRATFRQLLDAQDTELYGYFLGRLTPPTAALTTLIDQLLDMRTCSPL